MSISFHSIRSIIARRRLIRVVAGGCFAPLGLGGGTGEGGGGAAGDGGSRVKAGLQNGGGGGGAAGDGRWAMVDGGCGGSG
jgi:hypothetical protein